MLEQELGEALSRYAEIVVCRVYDPLVKLFKLTFLEDLLGSCLLRHQVHFEFVVERLGLKVGKLLLHFSERGMLVFLVHLEQLEICWCDSLVELVVKDVIFLLKVHLHECGSRLRCDSPHIH